MQILKKELLNNQKITWVVAGQSVPMCQGMALNRLKKEYPAKDYKKQGYFMPSRDFNFANELSMIRTDRLYYLIERRTELPSGEVKDCLIAFQENGDNIEGKAIFA